MTSEPHWMSYPAQKARPAPRRRIARTSASVQARSRFARRSSISSGPIAFRRSGRLSVSVATPSAASYRTVSAMDAQHRIPCMEGSTEQRTERSWLRCYRCWSQNLEVQVHYEGIHRIDPQTGERGEVGEELQEAVVQSLDCMHDQPHLGFHNGRVEPIEDRWERMVAGTPWVASCTVTVDGDVVETCTEPGAALSYAAFGDHGTREFFTHVRFHKHEGGEGEERIVIHLLVELYARSIEEATDGLEGAERGPPGAHSL